MERVSTAAEQEEEERASAAEKRALLAAGDAVATVVNLGSTNRRECIVCGLKQ